MFGSKLVKTCFVSCCASCLCLGTGVAALGKVGEQAIDELLVLPLTIFPEAGHTVGHKCTHFHVLVQ